MEAQSEVSAQSPSFPESEQETQTLEPSKPFAQFQSEVMVVAISPQGRTRIAVGLADGTVEIWDVLTGTKWVSCQGHTKSVISVSFSPDGKTLASGGGGNTIILWDVETGNQKRTLTGHRDYVRSVSFSPDGKTLASGSDDKKIILWDVKTGKQNRTLTGHDHNVYSVSFSPDGNTLASGSYDRKIILWDVVTGNQTLPLSGHENSVISVSFSPDGNTLASGSYDKTIILWDVKTGKQNLILNEHTGSVNSVSFSRDGKTLASGSNDKTIILWDVVTGNQNRILTGHTGSVRSVSFSRDGNTLASGSYDKTIILSDVVAGNQNLTLSGHTNSVNSVSFSRDGNTLASDRGKTIILWDVETGNQKRTLRHKGSVNNVSFSRDGKTLASGSDDNRIILWDVVTGNQTLPLSGHENSVLSVSFSRDGKTLASGSDDNRIILWDVETGNQTLLSGHENSVLSVSFSPDGKTLASGSVDKTIILWDVETGNQNLTLTGHKNSVRSVSFSPDGKTLASGSNDKTIILWDVETGNQNCTLTRHTDAVWSVSFSPDGKTLASGSRDKKIILWDLDDLQGKRYITIGQHEGAVYSVAFDTLKDDKGNYQKDYIISAGEDGIKVWRWQKFNLRSVPQAFSNDQPIGKDSLDVAKELESLADVLMLRSLEPPLAVAILGSWGSEKSFGMHLIEKQITKIRCQQITEKQTWGEQGDEPNLSPYVGHVYQIKFNAWSYAKSDLWASLMQTIFEQLDRQLTLEKQLAETPEKLLEGGDIWRVLNQMSDSDRKAILKLELGQDVFTNLKDDNALWKILGEVRKEEQEKLKKSEDKLQELETQAQKEKEKIEKETNQEFENKSRIIVFLTQLKELSKDDFGNSILKDFLNTYDFKDKNDLEAQFPIFQDLDKIQESDLIEKIEDLIKTKDGKIENIIKNSDKIKNFVEIQPSKIVGLIQFIKKDKRTLAIFILATSLPFILYFLLSILPFIKEIASALKLWLTTVSTIPTIGFGIEILKKLKVFQAKTSKLFQVAKESVEQEKQKLAADKDQKIQDKIKSKNSEIQQDIENLQAQIERQKQRIGLTAQYKSLLDFVNNRLEDNSYQKLLGLMHQIQDDLADLSDHLTYKPGKTNTEKLKILKEHFPRGPARIVLYIDDLDRCPPDKVVEVLEAVQLLLNTNIFIIVLAIDDRYIGRALENIYRGVLKRGGTPSGVDYLEKIIQLPYRMRPISKDVTAIYLKSLVDIEEKSQKDAREDSSIVTQTTELTETKVIEELPEKSSQDESIEISVNNEEKIEENYPPAKTSDIQKVSEPRTKKDNLEKNNQKILHSVNTDPLVTFECFTAEEFRWIKECCQHVDLTPRTAKRLVNICKIIRIIWTPTENDKTWKEPPTAEHKQTLIAFLALAGRYPKEMRKLLEEIYLEFEETDEDTVTINKDKWLNHLQNLDVFMDRHNQREWKKFKTDFRKMPPEKEFVFEKRTFNLATSFCFVGDIGYDPDDNYNREYRFEDSKKEYGFQKNYTKHD